MPFSMSFSICFSYSEMIVNFRLRQIKRWTLKSFVSDDVKRRRSAAAAAAAGGGGREEEDESRRKDATIWTGALQTIAWTASRVVVIQGGLRVASYMWGNFRLLKTDPHACRWTMGSWEKNILLLIDIVYRNAQHNHRLCSRCSHCTCCSSYCKFEVEQLPTAEGECSLTVSGIVSLLGLSDVLRPFEDISPTFPSVLYSLPCGNAIYM